MKTVLTDTTLVDFLVVLKGLPADEIEQIEAFSGSEFSVENVANQVFNAGGPRWTIRVKETGEPIVVGGLIPVNGAVWRTWFFANQRAWDEYGREVTVHTAKTLKKMLEGVPNARVETVCLATRRKAQEWYKACGLKYESTMHGYGVNGEAAVIYTAVKGARGY